MDTRKIINPIDILWAFQEEPASISSAAESRSTIHRFIVEDTVGWKLAVHSPSGYNTTSVADLIIQYYNELEEDVQNEVASLAALEYGPILLDILSNTTATSKAEMARQSGASRSTVQRNIREFLSDDFEWVSKQNNRYRLTDSGNRVLAAYESFQDKIKVIAEKSEFLERFEEAGLLPSVETLDGSRMVVSTATDRQPVVREINRIEPSDAEPLRGISQAFSEEISDAYCIESTSRYRIRANCRQARLQGNHKSKAMEVLISSSPTSKL